MTDELKGGTAGSDGFFSELALPELARLLKNILSSSRDSFWVIDRQGRMVEVNEAYVQLSGYSRKELLTMGVNDLTVVEKPLETMAHMQRIIEKGSDLFETRHRLKDGRILDIEISVTYLEMGAGYFICFCRDISEQKRHEAEHERFETAITRVMELESQLKQAEKIQAIGVLAGGIAHDFNNILFPIIGFSELLMEDLKDDDFHRQKAEEIFNGARRATDLVKQILAISRQARPEPRLVSVQELLSDVLSLARSAIPNNVAIESELAIETGMLMIEPTHLHQMVLNMITNAYQALEKDCTGVIRLAASIRKVDDSDRPALILADGQYVEIAVSDSGSGLSSEMIKRIFEPCFTTKVLDAGVELGLSIAQGLAREYGGDVTAKSQQGQGSLFTLYLPLMDSAVERVNLEPEERPSGRERILLVDDESTIVRMVTIILERLGYQVSGYSMGEEALAAFRADPDGFDLVISDMAMPLMTGLQLAQAIKAINPQQLILICTGYSEQFDREQVLALGVSGLLVKPLLGKQLAAEVRRVLDEDVRTRIRGRILVIDDEAPVRHLFREKLAGPHCQIIEAANGAEGLAICRREKPDLVITDLIMPEKEGIETIMELRRVFPDLPIIAISGGGRSTHPEPYLSLAQRLGARQVFAKPIDWQPFFRALAELLTRKE